MQPQGGNCGWVGGWVGGGRGQKFVFFPLSRPHFSFFCSLSGGLLVEFWWCFWEGRDPPMCTFGVLGPICETPCWVPVFARFCSFMVVACRHHCHAIGYSSHLGKGNAVHQCVTLFDGDTPQFVQVRKVSGLPSSKKGTLAYWVCYSHPPLGWVQTATRREMCSRADGEKISSLQI